MVPSGLFMVSLVSVYVQKAFFTAHHEFLLCRRRNSLASIENHDYSVDFYHVYTLSFTVNY
jgi:hypothetical protein